ncbi:MAG TPA: arsenic resistance N-acetyltransferase ArsN2 [Longimicrobium sp.]|uniref:arsenic resistance N-acetyltransferase ArsN2 n=1 Tax=Longimicrobium sp. TaxID=2029185 RepID=UPI002ED868C0
MTTMNLTIRPARAEDLEPVLRLVQAAALPTDGIPEHWGDPYAVAVEGDTVLGVAGVEVHGRSGLLRSVAVAPDARGTGLGQALTRDRVEWARAAGLDALYLLTTTAEEFFPRLGFLPIDRDSVPADVRASGEFCSVCPASAAVLWLPLEEGGAAPLQEELGRAISVEVGA